MNFGYTTENHNLFEKQKFYKEILKYVSQNYLASEGSYNNYISMDSFSSYHTYFLALIIFEKEDKTIYTYFTLKIFNQNTKHSYYTLFMIDNNIHNTPVNINDFKKIATAPNSNVLGSYFLNEVSQFTFNHFTFIGNIDRMVINLKSGKNEYEITKQDYISIVNHFRGINNAFIISALNHIYIKRTILKLLAEATYIDTPLHKEWHNKLEKTMIQGYSLKYLPSHNLRSELDKIFIDDKEFEFIEKVHFENTNNIISKQQKVVESKINFLNIIILIFTIISLGQIVDIFTDDKWLIISTIIAVGIATSIIYIKYSNWLKR